ncbi:MAG: hypothetical protein IIB46_04885, partial [Nitrospinae bacterium]|nr:hypothetical protein [Nitrospinota bacterium]
KKMKYGHRGANQPIQDLRSGRCLITTQNHGFEVDADSLPKDFETWFRNLNDGSVEGIRHRRKPTPPACGPCYFSDTGPMSEPQPFPNPHRWPPKWGAIARLDWILHPHRAGCRNALQSK